MTSTIDFSKFYVVWDSFNRKAMRSPLDILENEPKRRNWKKINEDYPYPDLARRLWHGGVENFEGRIELFHYSGGKPYDIVWSTSLYLICVSNNLVSHFRAKEVSGWKIYPVRLHERNGDYLPTYHGLSITGKGLDFVPERSLEFLDSSKNEWPKTKRVLGLYFQQDQWDNSDMFFVSNRLVVTEKVKAIFKNEKIRNVTLTPLPEVILDYSNYQQMIKNISAKNP